jgi:hypothetical protein
MKKINKNIIAGLAIAAVFAAGGCTKRSDLSRKRLLNLHRMLP